MRALLLVVLAFPASALAQDLDVDGILDGQDNCLGVFNPNQEDANGDGFGDACVEPTATIVSDLTLGSGSSIQARATVGAGVTIGQGTVVARRASVGASSDLGDGVLLGRSATVGSDADLRNGVSLGYGVQTGTNLTAFGSATIGSVVQAGHRVTLQAFAVVARGSVLGDDVTIGAGTTLGPGTQLGAGAQVAGNVRVRKDVTIGAGASVGTGSRIGRGATIQAGVQVGEDVTVGAGATVVAGAVVPDGTVILRGESFGSAGEICGDGIDNDSNGLFDCEEAVCVTDPACGPEVCTDDIDNDGDGDRDCADADCIADPECSLGITHLSNVTYIENRRTFESSYPNGNYWNTYSGSGTCANLPDALVPNFNNQTVVGATRLEVTGISGRVTRQVPYGSGSYLVPVNCDWNVAEAIFSGSGSVVDLVSRTGFTIDPGCDIAGDSFLPTQLRVDFQPEQQTYSGGTTTPRIRDREALIFWGDDNWYMIPDQQGTPNEIPLGYSSPEPFGNCGDMVDPNHNASLIVNWGPDCQCSGQYNRTRRDLRWGFSGAVHTVQRTAP